MGGQFYIVAHNGFYPATPCAVITASTPALPAIRVDWPEPSYPPPATPILLSQWMAARNKKNRFPLVSSYQPLPLKPLSDILNLQPRTCNPETAAEEVRGQEVVGGVEMSTLVLSDENEAEESVIMTPAFHAEDVTIEAPSAASSSAVTVRLFGTVVTLVKTAEVDRIEAAPAAPAIPPTLPPVPPSVVTTPVTRHDVIVTPTAGEVMSSIPTAPSLTMSVAPVATVKTRPSPSLVRLSLPLAAVVKPAKPEQTSVSFNSRILSAPTPASTEASADVPTAPSLAPVVAAVDVAPAALCAPPIAPPIAPHMTVAHRTATISSTNRERQSPLAVPTMSMIEQIQQQQRQRAARVAAATAVTAALTIHTTPAKLSDEESKQPPSLRPMHHTTLPPPLPWSSVSSSRRRGGGGGSVRAVAAMLEEKVSFE